MKRKYYIDLIDKYHNIIGELRDEYDDGYSISEYDSVYQDILDYEDDEFEDWTTKDFEDFIEYLGDLTNAKLK